MGMLFRLHTLFYYKKFSNCLYNNYVIYLMKLGYTWKGLWAMISSKKFIRLLSADDAEVEKTIENMSEKDAKELIRFLMSFIKNYNKPTIWYLYKDC